MQLEHMVIGIAVSPLTMRIKIESSAFEIANNYAYTKVH